MSAEVTEVLVVVGGEVADSIVCFGRCVDDGLGVMGESS